MQTYVLIFKVTPLLSRINKLPRSVLYPRPLAGLQTNRSGSSIKWQTFLIVPQLSDLLKIILYFPLRCV